MNVSRKIATSLLLNQITPTQVLHNKSIYDFFLYDILYCTHISFLMNRQHVVSKISAALPEYVAAFLTRISPSSHFPHPQLSIMNLIKRIFSLTLILIRRTIQKFHFIFYQANRIYRIERGVSEGNFRKYSHVQRIYKKYTHSVYV